TVYPIGLRYALFSFRSEGLGIPLGPSGIYIHGIMGALAFGPPGPEMDEYLRDKFGSGMRISLGVYLQDQTGTIKGSAGFWDTLVNWDFTAFGTLDILNRLIRAEVFASITQNYGFEASITVSIELVGGKAGVYGGARVHIWEQNGTRLAAEAWVKLVVRKGLLTLGPIEWPSKNLTFGPIGIEF